jgi:hypothetical protein
LDDSDESIIDTKKIVDRLSSEGLDIKLITRSNRIGFKAGF